MNAVDWPRYHYVGIPVLVHDGDTLKIDIDLGIEVHVQPWIRLIGCNAPELHGATAAAGAAARDYLTTLVAGRLLYLATEKLPSQEEEQQSFARWLARVYLNDGTGVLADVAQSMIRSGNAVPM